MTVRRAEGAGGQQRPPATRPEGGVPVYRFAGFFAKPPLDPPACLPEAAVGRSVSVPFAGVGVRLPALIGGSPDPSEVGRLLRQVGLHAAPDWLDIAYDCWGGRIDQV